jgi:hypothetical protein
MSFGNKSSTERIKPNARCDDLENLQAILTSKVNVHMTQFCILLFQIVMQIYDMHILMILKMSSSR